MPRVVQFNAGCSSIDKYLNSLQNLGFHRNRITFGVNFDLYLHFLIEIFKIFTNFSYNFSKFIISYQRKNAFEFDIPFVNLNPHLPI